MNHAKPLAPITLKLCSHSLPSCLPIRSRGVESERETTRGVSSPTTTWPALAARETRRSERTTFGIMCVRKCLVVLAGGHVDEAAVVALERDDDRAGRSVAVLGHDQVGLACTG